ncbi:MAG: LysR family transcriptional regulator [Cyanobacteriota bacterium]|nr:LysR family transcriptional regulator [Cyanobacteriota bacterium]
MLNLDQVQVFLSVAGHLHFSKAAAELYISQSAVSASIAKLEAQLGVPLFHRIGRRVRLTEAGHFLHREGQQLIDRAKELERQLDDFSGLQRGSLHLGASFTVGNYWLPAHLARFRVRYPGIAIHCELGNAEAILYGSQAGRFDLSFLTGRSPGAPAKVVGNESLTLVVGRGHPWFGQPLRQPRQLLATPWLLREAGSGTRQMLERSLSDIGISLQDLSVHQELRSNEMVKTMVVAGDALAALPASMVAQDIHAKVLWPITLAGYVLRAEAIWMVRGPHRRESALMNHFEALIQTGGAGFST